MPSLVEALLMIDTVTVTDGTVCCIDGRWTTLLSRPAPPSPVTVKLAAREQRTKVYRLFLGPPGVAPGAIFPLLPSCCTDPTNNPEASAAAVFGPSIHLSTPWVVIALDLLLAL